MPARQPGSVHALALVGPSGAGKTALLEAMLAAASGRERRGGSDGEARGQSVEMTVTGFEFLGDRYAVVDTPGSVEFSSEGDFALPAVDLAVVVVDADPDKAVLLQPTLKELERLDVPHVLFVNKIDQARGSLRDLLDALAPVSAEPLVARQIPIWGGEQVVGFVDLARERAVVSRPAPPPPRVDRPGDMADTEAEARFHMLEQRADFDDDLLEQLLSDVTPSQDAVFADLSREMRERLITPVFFGSALNGFGVRRLLKALRHEIPPVEAAAARLGAGGPGAYVLKTSHAGQAGKLAYARVLGGTLADGADLVLPSGEHGRAGGLYAIQGGASRRAPSAELGDIVAIGKIEQAAAGDILSLTGRPQQTAVRPSARPPLFALAVAAVARKDDVRLSGALAKLVEEDPGLSLTHDAETHEVLLRGQGEAHVRQALDRLRRRYGVEVETGLPSAPYKETIVKSVSQRGRHKKQTGGHGQFGDVTIEIKPRERGAGFLFSQKITGGAVPKQWIPAVEQGVRDALEKGPLGFPVIDVEVTLVDGAYHSVDSSEMSFRAAGRLAMGEGLQSCGSCLMEPIEKLDIYSPSACTSKITSALSGRRGQILGFGPRDGWPGWDRIEAHLPQAERRDLIAELRSLTQGLATFETGFAHMAEVHGRLADEITQKARTAA